MSSFDPTPPDKDLSQRPEAFKRQTLKVTPARIGWGILMVIALTFVVQNGDRVDFRFLVFRVDQVALWIVIVIALVLGVLLGLLMASMRRRRKDRHD